MAALPRELAKGGGNSPALVLGCSARSVAVELRVGSDPALLKRTSEHGLSELLE